MDKKRYLVTGGAGFIGSNIAFELQNQGHEVTIMDDFSSGNFKNLLGFKGDVTAADVFKFMPEDVYFDAIFHEAAITDTTIHDQKLMMEMNVEAFKNVLHFAASNEIKRVVYASSAGTYGQNPCPMTETQVPMPENVYGFSKAVMDNVAREFASDHQDMVIVGLRYFNVYGPGEYYKGHTASMIYQLYNQMKAGKNPKIFKMGEQQRDFVYIKDVVKANLCALTAKESCVVNVGFGTPRTYNDVVACLNKETGLNLQPDYIDNPYPFFQLKTEADLTLANQKIGYTPDYNLEKGIEEYVQILNKRPVQPAVKK
ncbi:ADP-L-glycero-D-manno-heptose-6-epimerase [Elusimicrobium minutum Pei191]|uniref:ADP-L-glycero-D-manno-heptose-6-epimerase n=1 Tax=Elusimicrobium minutum (strain Pei191) TaxID=445932 RepID=B2KEX1_ELUMP|nr:ADP-glyceromanno-heptose 6-epimerase [Elusimicrobium minutum]ACC99067.1 ADP-L-glycero-D-manno-heptose-6-epimerase [Elusimicrobium minutum Pei191]